MQSYKLIVSLNALNDLDNVVAYIASLYRLESGLKYKERVIEQVSLFQNFESEEKLRKEKRNQEKKDMNLQKTIVEIKHKYGKNAILKGMNFEEGGTMRERNMEVGGHRG